MPATARERSRRRGRRACPSTSRAHPCASARRENPTDARGAPRAAIADASASSASNTRRSSRGLARGDPRLGRDVLLVAAVPVEMVGRDREHTATRGWNVSEHASWNDETSATSTSTSSSTASISGRPMLPAATRAHARRVQHLGGERGDRRLAVGAGDRDDRHAGAARRRGRSRCAPRHPRRGAATSAGCSSRTSGLGTTRSAAPTSARRPDRRRGASTSVGAERAHRLDPRRVRAVAPRRVLEHGHVPAFGAQAPRHRDTGLGEADHEHAARSLEPRPEQVQEVGVEDADRRARRRCPRTARTARSP